ncbi:hypothetical protein [Kitasatospora viridis]|uniref:MazG-like nucleotide pyrophosphohydrolase family protein n=1 Tax=Kitasatospora viridis TaxID=281105 RepID=A0A561TTD2_9ACTN|nr:hypothetical protein [Kitasatospora viridis]TWF90376.1 hypothetical protein FHX73_13420 [Kitasatospora viridis]
MSGRTWQDLRERLHDLSDLGDEMHADMEWGQARLLFAITATMAADACQLARDLETELLNLAAENGVPLPPLDLGGGS